MKPRQAVLGTRNRTLLTTEINGWSISLRAPNSPYYIAHCPVCHEKRNVTLVSMRQRSQCHMCARAIKNRLAGVSRATRDAMKLKYAEHVRICMGLKTDPEPLDSFLRDYLDYPELLADNSSIVYRDEGISSASPLTWTDSFADR